MGFLGSSGSIGKITESDLPSTVKEKLVKVNEIGDLSQLKTSNKSSLTAATNEVATQLADTSTFVPMPTGNADTDRNAIQTALNNKGHIIFPKNQVYIVNKSGLSKSSIPYALEIPSNTRVDLNGSTIKLADGQNCSLFVNQNFVTTTDAYNMDKNISLENGVIDGNYYNQSQTFIKFNPTLYFRGVDDWNYNKLTIINAYQYALYILYSYNGFMDNLIVDEALGGGISIMKAYNIQCGKLITKNIKTFPDPIDVSSVGNPFIATLYHSSIDSLHVVNSYWGVKIQDSSHDVTINSMICEGGSYTDRTTFGAVKIQGNSVYSGKRVSVNSIIVKNWYGAGLYITMFDGVNVGSYQGERNGDSTYADGKFKSDCVIFNAKDVSIGELKSVDSFNQALWIQSGGSSESNRNIQFNNINIHRTNEQPSFNGNLIHFYSTRMIKANTVTVTDDSTTKTWSRIWHSALSPTTYLSIGRIYSNVSPVLGSTLFGCSDEFAGGVDIGQVKLGGDGVSGTLALESGKSAIFVGNKNIWQGERMLAVIQLIPTNADAQEFLRTKGYHISIKAFNSSPGYGFTLNYDDPGVGKTPRFSWVLLGYCKSS